MTTRIQLPAGANSARVMMPAGADSYRMQVPADITCDPSLIVQPSNFNSGVAGGWGVRGGASVTPDIEKSPSGDQDADRVTVGPGSGVDIYMELTGLTPDAPLDFSFWIKRITTSGILYLDHSGSGALGSWQVNLGNIPSNDWELLDKNHVAVSESPWQAKGTTFNNKMFSNDGILIEFFAWCSHLVET